MHITEGLFEFPGTAPAAGPFLVSTHCRPDGFSSQFWITSGPSDPVVMVVISCISFTVNNTANHFIFDESDVVSAIGTFPVGFLGNVYSRRFGGATCNICNLYGDGRR